LRFRVRTLEGGVNLPADGNIAHEQKIPGLHETDGRSMMSGVQNPRQGCGVQRLVPEAANVTALEDGTIQPVLLAIRKWYSHDSFRAMA
jgi:hypothetical protein